MTAATHLPIPKATQSDRRFGWFPTSWFSNWHWLDTHVMFPESILERPETHRVSFQRTFPFLSMHLACIALFWVGASWGSVILAIVLYYVRMFAITGFYHRYFSHRTFETSRVMQFVFAVWGMLSVQKGPLWWAAHHRHHHKMSDAPEDTHSVKQGGFLWAHMGWICTDANMVTHYKRVPDLAKYPELVFINRFDWIVPVLYALTMLALGPVVEKTFPEWGISAGQFFVWGFIVSTVMLYHGTFSINSLAHVWGNRRYQTTDDSRNNFWLSLLTLGEGWHNNHHKYQGAVRQGFYWWELDITFYILKAMSWLGLVWNLHPVPQWAYQPEYQLKN